MAEEQQKKDESVSSEELDFPKLFFIQINRYFQVISDGYIGSAEMIVDGLENLMVNFWDSEYEEEKKKIDGSYDDSLKILNIKSSGFNESGLFFDASNKEKEISIAFIKNKFRALMNLAGRKGMLVKKEDYGEDLDA